MKRSSPILSDDPFESVRRQSFRRVFQPSRIVLGVFLDPACMRPNVITLCFDMHCSYKPPMFAFAVWNGSHTSTLLKDATECVLAVPGEKLASSALSCGTLSGRDVDKMSACGFTSLRSSHISVPGIRECIANVELKVVGKHQTGDHTTVFGEVLRYGVDRTNRERCLVSVGPEYAGYKVLAQKGIHRIAVVANA